MRLFFAVTLPEAALERVSEAQASLRGRIGEDGVRWTRRDQFHYTLKFLGELQPKRAYEAVEAAQEAAGALGSFELALGGIGAFPNAERPSVLWLGATEGSDSMRALASALDRALQARRFRAERQPLRAHLTLARVKSYSGEMAVSRALRAPDDAEVARTETGSFVLMQSRPSPDGSQYHVVETFQLRGQVP
jgi:2'-5' RNA ligase